MFIISLTYTQPLDLVDKYIPEHVEFLKQQYLAGHFQLSCRKEPRTGGVILATVESRSKLDDILALDPFNRERLAVYEVTEVTPTMSSPELKSLVVS